MRYLIELAALVFILTTLFVLFFENKIVIHEWGVITGDELLGKGKDFFPMVKKPVIYFYGNENFEIEFDFSNVELTKADKCLSNCYSFKVEFTDSNKSYYKGGEPARFVCKKFAAQYEIPVCEKNYLYFEAKIKNKKFLKPLFKIKFEDHNLVINNTSNYWIHDFYYLDVNNCVVILTTKTGKKHIMDCASWKKGKFPYAFLRDLNLDKTVYKYKLYYYHIEKIPPKSEVKIKPYKIEDRNYFFDYLIRNETLPAKEILEKELPKYLYKPEVEDFMKEWEKYLTYNSVKMLFILRNDFVDKLIPIKVNKPYEAERVYVVISGHPMLG
jgi:hypothetical protein